MLKQQLLATPSELRGSLEGILHETPAGNNLADAVKMMHQCVGPLGY